MTQYRGINIDYERDALLPEQGVQLMKNFYMKDFETSPQEAFARAAIAWCAGDLGLAQRIYDGVSRGWFMFASPVLSNAPVGHWVGQNWYGNTSRHMPISCFLVKIPDTIDGQIAKQKEIAALSVSGGGLGVHNGIRAISNKAPGPIPYMKVLDAQMGYYMQGGTRRGAMAYFMDVDHPDIVEHIYFREPKGDKRRKSDNTKAFHHGVNITYAFEEAVVNDEVWHLRCPHTKEIRETIRARELWQMILEVRSERGEPFLIFIDAANEQFNPWQKALGKRVTSSNLCTEIFEYTDADHTAVCCLSSLNAAKFDEWKDTTIVRDVIRMLDNVMSYFIQNAPDGLENAVRSAKKERSLGLGVMGLHTLFMQKGLPFDKGGMGSSFQLTNILFSHIKKEAVAESELLAQERGEPEDLKGSGRRNAHLLANAPNSNSAAMLGVSEGRDPLPANIFVNRTRAGAHKRFNPALRPILAGHGMDTEEIYSSILHHDGSVQHLDFLTEDEKRLLRTAFEIDQEAVIDHAIIAQKHVCQGQSINLFFPNGADRGYVNRVHLKAMKSHVIKSLYYFRTSNEQKADVAIKHTATSAPDCIACEG